MVKETQSELSKDEEEAMRYPIEFRCHRCGKVFHQSEGDVFKEDSVGYFYCHDCQRDLEREGKGRDREKVFRVR
jgi:transcription elongation factor Elf1